MLCRKKDSEKEKAYILELLKAGYGYKEIGLKLGYARTTIYNKFQRYGITPLLPYEDLAGKRFSKLLVIKFIGRKSYGHILWLCLCDCGKEAKVTTNHLTRGKVKSCGCGRYKHTKCGEISTAFWELSQKCAIKRGLEFTISIEEAWDIFQSQGGKCALSGLDISLDFHYQVNKQSASFDRIDSTKGYISGNCQWLHKKVNLMKHSHTMDELLYLVGKIYDKNSNTIQQLGNVTIGNTMWAKRKRRIINKAVSPKKAAKSIEPPEDWHKYHHADCGTQYRGCHPTLCPKNQFEETGIWKYKW